MLVTIVRTSNRIISYSGASMVSHNPEKNELRMELEDRVTTVADIKHYAVFADNGTEIFSAQNINKGLDND